MQVTPKLSQEALGKLIGVSKVTISDLERGAMALTVDYMRRIAEALNVKSADLLTSKDNPDSLSVEERRLIEQLRRASPEQREQVQRVADVIAPFPSAETVETLQPRRRA